MSTCLGGESIKSGRPQGSVGNIPQSIYLFENVFKLFWNVVSPKFIWLWYHFYRCAVQRLYHVKKNIWIYSIKSDSTTYRKTINFVNNDSGTLCRAIIHDSKYLLSLWRIWGCRLLRRLARWFWVAIIKRTVSCGTLLDRSLRSVIWHDSLLNPARRKLARKDVVCPFRGTKLFCSTCDSASLHSALKRRYAVGITLGLFDILSNDTLFSAVSRKWHFEMKLIVWPQKWWASHDKIWWLCLDGFTSICGFDKTQLDLEIQVCMWILRTERPPAKAFKIFNIEQQSVLW